MGDYKKILLLDFDGVLHAYTSGWKGIDVIPDSPVEDIGNGMTSIEYIRKVIADDRFEACIYSSRSKEQAGIDAMRAWLLSHKLLPEELEQVKFPTEKPAAFFTIDDRAMCFEGKFPNLNELAAFVPWNKRVLYVQGSMREPKEHGS